MAYQIEKTYTSFWGGISDDDFLGTENAVKDLDGIDVQTQERYAQASEAYIETFTYALVPTWVKNTPNGAFRGNTSETMNYSWWQLSWVIWTVIDRMESYGTGTDQVNYFFSRTGWVKVTNYNGTTLTTTITTNYPTANVEVTAVGWHVTNLLFAKEDKIYFLDTANNYINTTIISTTVGATNWSATITTNDTTGWTRWATITWTGIPASTTIISIINGTSAVISNNFTWTTGNVSIKIWRDTGVLQLTLGTKIKYIYSYSFDSTVVVATNGNDTYIYELEFTGWGYNIVSKTPLMWYLALDAVGNRYDTFILTTFGIFQYQGRQISDKPDKYLILSTSARVGWDRGVLIGDWFNIYKWRAIKPWRNQSLSRYTVAQSVIDVDWDDILTFSGSNSSIQDRSGAYKRTNTIQLLPLDGGSFQIPKQDLNFRFGYMFASGSYTNSATRQAIVIKIQTDWMQMINSTSYVEVWRVTDGDTTDSLGNNKYGFMEITPDMIVTALTWYTTEFSYVNIKIEILAGDEYASPASYYRKTPKIFDFTNKSNFVKNV